MSRHGVARLGSPHACSPSWFSTFHATESGWDCDRCRWQVGSGSLSTSTGRSKRASCTSITPCTSGSPTCAGGPASEARRHTRAPIAPGTPAQAWARDPRHVTPFGCRSDSRRARAAQPDRATRVRQHHWYPLRASPEWRFRCSSAGRPTAEAASGHGRRERLEAPRTRRFPARSERVWR